MSLAHLRRRLGSRKLVLIRGKHLRNLTRSEVAEMIDVHLGKQGRFDSSALYEFMLVPNKGELEIIRLRIEGIDEACRKPENLDGLSNDCGREELSALAVEIRSGAQAT